MKRTNHIGPLDPEGLPENYKTISREGRQPDKYDQMYMQRIASGQYDHKAEHRARRPQKKQ
jgi:hypothetical protein